MGEVQTTPTPTVADLLDRYQAECLPSLAPRTARDYVRHIGHLKARFGDRVAAELKPKDFGPFIQEKSGRKGQVQRVRQLAVLSAAFTQAVSFWYLIDHNVLRDVKRPKRPPRDRLIEDHEFQAVRAGAPLRVQLMMDLALRLGQRQGDLLDLQWSSIKDGFVNLQQGKTGKRLAIEITPELKRVFGRCWMLPNRGEYVITRKCGGRYTSEGYRALWQRTSGAEVSLKQIRKTYGVPARRGARVEFTSPAGSKTEGTITGSFGLYLRMRLDCNAKALRYHPTAGIRYLPSTVEAPHHD